MNNINFQQEKKRIINFIRESIEKLGRKGAVLGLSGGLDSSTSAYLLKKALGRNKILTLILPERDNDPQNMNNARMIAKKLNLKNIEINISGVLEKIGVYNLGLKEIKNKKDMADMKKKQKFAEKLLGPHIIFKELAEQYGLEKNNPAFKVIGREIHELNAFSLTKVKLRMLYLHYYSKLKNYAVIGTLDKTEWSVGLFDKHGDGACDIAILRHLYKTQIRELAKHIGVPLQIVHQPSSGDLYGSVVWESLMGLSYEQVDKILMGLEKGCPENQLTSIVSKETLKILKRGVEAAQIMKALPLSID